MAKIYVIASKVIDTPVWFTGRGWSAERPDALEISDWGKAVMRLDRETTARSVGNAAWQTAEVVEEEKAA